MNTLEIKNLSKSFGKTRIIKDVSLHVSEGEIVAFVGPNGAGKTTTLKMITNLIWPDSGSITIAGYDLFKQREMALANMAGIIENPGLYTNLTGLENLQFIQKLRGVSKARLQEVIELIGLNDKEKLHRKVRRYSLGMKQRLALGMCLLTKPKFLILDEPTNGLDPTGVIELRQLIEKMVKEENVSVLFSSHMLGEVEKLADRIVYIKEGSIITERIQQKEDSNIYNIHLENQEEKAAQILRKLSCCKQVELQVDGILHIEAEVGNLNLILKTLGENAITIIDIEKEKQSLEDIYRSIFTED
ncbi:ABC-2 type transport system ATP-binding protein [Anaerosporobacter mobilis DSM 15930]|uniref:ABC-2 type transport system ATP-binding protein n=1 Tax=Anaerosporobacter mobilis DSM 15930 TaxID=1120996 RepID=A0A1M7LYJ3_9FIRM|nr:ABC transporter ATP-binding protein [Anaerosporobacter mobilis]SHM82914.1 ABC-2 type transport system ATP-binding protein [Anaerosporobacter mobilis DSM 15930]